MNYIMIQVEEYTGRNDIVCGFPSREIGDLWVKKCNNYHSKETFFPFVVSKTPIPNDVDVDEYKRNQQIWREKHPLASINIKTPINDWDTYELVEVEVYND